MPHCFELFLFWLEFGCFALYFALAFCTVSGLLPPITFLLLYFAPLFCSGPDWVPRFLACRLALLLLLIVLFVVGAPRGQEWPGSWDSMIRWRFTSGNSIQPRL